MLSDPRENFLVYLILTHIKDGFMEVFLKITNNKKYLGKAKNTVKVRKKVTHQPNK